MIYYGQNISAFCDKYLSCRIRKCSQRVARNQHLTSNLSNATVLEQNQHESKSLFRFIGFLDQFYILYVHDTFYIHWLYFFFIIKLYEKTADHGRYFLNCDFLVFLLKTIYLMNQNLTRKIYLKMQTHFYGEICQSTD